MKQVDPPAEVLKRLCVFALVVLAVATARAAESPALKSVAPAGLRIGVALNRAEIDGTDAGSLDIATRNFNSITPENILKWEKVHPAPDRFDFELADKFVALGQAHGMFVVGHVLVWHQQTPAWVFENANREVLLSRMRDHNSSVVGRYRGRIGGWDVVNEALDEDGTLRKTPWLAGIGDDYIAKAFEFAHEADPQAELYYNEYNLWKPAKRDAAIRLVNQLRARGLRVDGIGEQAHWGVTEPPIAQIDETVSALASGAGVKVMLTELDVDVLPRDPEMWGADLSKKAKMRVATNIYPNGLPEPQQRRLAERYSDIFRVVMKHREHVSRVTLWGVTDAQSWLHNFPIPGRINYPLLWDRDGRPKPALDAVVQVLKEKR